MDLNPLDPISDCLRLLGYIWADRPDHLAHARTALDLAAKLHSNVDKADTADWLESRVQTPSDLLLIFHTVAWQYFPPATQSRASAAMEAAGEAGPVARLSMEADGNSPGAVLSLTLWPEGKTIPLGRADFHGRWVDWTAPPP